MRYKNAAEIVDRFHCTTREKNVEAMARSLAVHKSHLTAHEAGLAAGCMRDTSRARHRLNTKVARRGSGYFFRATYFGWLRRQNNPSIRSAVEMSQRRATSLAFTKIKTTTHRMDPAVAASHIR
jgi:hypothetical protein